MRRQIRFCTAPDGVRPAYALYGGGPPVVRAATWPAHIDFDREGPVWRHWLHALGDGHTLVRHRSAGHCSPARSTPPMCCSA